MALTLDRPAVESSHLRRLTWLLVAMAVAIGADQAFQWATHDVAPGLFLLPAVIVIAAVGGLVDGLAAAAIALVFAAVDLGGTGPLWVPPYDRAVRLLVLCVSAPTAGLVVGLMRRRLMERSATKLSDRVQAERTRADARATSDGRAFAAERASLLHERDALADIDREHQRRLTDLIEAVPGVVWEVVIDGPRLRVAFISHYIQDLLGYDADRWTGSGDLWSSAVHPDDRDRVARWLREACDSGTTAASNAAPCRVPVARQGRVGSVGGDAFGRRARCRDGRPVRRAPRGDVRHHGSQNARGGRGPAGGGAGHGRPAVAGEQRGARPIRLHHQPRTSRHPSAGSRTCRTGSRRTSAPTA